MALTNINSSTATIRDVPLTYSTIQAALNSCMIGDTVLVSPGVYLENIIWPNIMDIKLYSSGDSSNTIIDGNHSGRVLDFNTLITIGNNTEIIGFKLRNGYINDVLCKGAGIKIENCSPKFEQVSIENNHIFSSNWGYGSGVHLTQSNATFKYSSISGNSIDTSKRGGGCGVYITTNSNPTFENVTINNNHIVSSTWGEGGGIYVYQSSPIFKNVLINNNKISSKNYAYGNGVYCDNSNLSFENVKISENTSDSGALYYYGGGIYFKVGNLEMTNVLINSNIFGANGNYYGGAGIYYSGPFNHTNYTANLMNLTVVDNHHIDTTFGIFGTGLICENCDSVKLNITNSIFYNQNSAIELIKGGGIANIKYSNIRGGYVGVGNVNSNPNFVSNSDWHLNALSPCNGAGTQVGAPLFDLENNLRPSPTGSNPDMGCYESPYGYILNISNTQMPRIDCFPNPVKDVLKINFHSSTLGDIKYQLVNMQGLQISSSICKLTNQGNYSSQIDMSEFSAGFYLLKVEQECKHITISIIKE